MASQLNTQYDKYYNEGRVKFITFHPSYSYEEFVEGVTVETGEENTPCEKLLYKLKTGIFKEMCKDALGAAIKSQDVDKKRWKEIFDEYKAKLASGESVNFEEAPRYVLIIDEINRGDIAKIFGELITLLEADKRMGCDNRLIVKLPMSGDDFSVPPNLYIIATMNTADRSIALLDVALRRRFGFVEMNPNFDILKAEHVIKNKAAHGEELYRLLNYSIEAIEKINDKICSDPNIGRDKQIGHSFLFKVNNKSNLVLVWKHEILPLLEEYCYGDYKKINYMLFNKDTSKWVSESKGIQEIININEMLGEILQDE